MNADNMSPDAMTPLEPTRLFVSWVRSAAPYIHSFRGKTFVVAFGGEVVKGPAMTSLVHDCNLLAALGIKLVLVAGARPQIEDELAARGLAPVYHRGLRVTDLKALECVKRAYGAQRIDIEALFSQGLPNTPMAESTIEVASGNFLTAKPVGVVDGVDYMYTGAVRRVDAEALQDTLADSDIVLVQPYGYSPSGEVFNLSMEEVAESVAVALQAQKLIFLCDAPGIEDQHGALVAELTADDAQAWLRAGHGVTEDLGVYLPGAIRAVRAGVSRVHFIDYKLDGSLLLEFFTREGVGSVVSREALARTRQATLEDIGAIIGIIGPLEDDGTLVKRSRELLEQEVERFSVIEHDGVVVGCAALYPFSEEAAAELACVAVLPEYRRHGYGDQIMHYMQARARTIGLRRLFVLTTRTAHWFVERGFRETAVDALPKKKRELYNLQRMSKILVKDV
jgi:amino-acid N-acetyltransferase